MTSKVKTNYPAKKTSYSWRIGIRLAIQIQHYGGKNSKVRTNDPENKTSYSWRRDVTVVSVMDCFHQDDLAGEAKKAALAWQKENDEGSKGVPGVSEGHFSPGYDWRVLWGSYFDDNPEYKDLNKARLLYHETNDKYKRLQAIKERVDPKGTFTPNVFSVHPDDPPTA
eukprot:gene7262-374_t